MSTIRNLDYVEEDPSDITLQESKNGNGNGNGARYSKGAGTLQEPMKLLKQTVAIDHDATVNYYVFTLAATLVATVYALTFAVWGDWDTPQPVIAVCLGLAAAFLWVWKGWFGKGVALAAFGCVLYEYAQWFAATSQLKSNTGRGDLPGGGLLGNYLYGASWLDPLALIAVVGLLCLSVCFLKPHIKSLLNANVAKGDSREEDSHGSVTTIQGTSHS